MKRGRGVLSSDIDYLTTFGYMVFGASAEQWDEEIFYYRTGIAMKLWEDGVGRMRM